MMNATVSQPSNVQHALTNAPAPVEIDIRPLFAQGQSPCGVIDAAVAALQPGQPLVLLVPFEPVPLYAKLGHQGFSHQTTRTADGAWRVQFQR